MSLLKLLKDRWQSETPKFFLSLKRISISLGTSATALWVTNETMSLDLHDNVLSICKYVIAFTAATGLTSQLTRVDNPVDNPNQ